MPTERPNSDPQPERIYTPPPEPYKDSDGERIEKEQTGPIPDPPDRPERSAP